MGHPGGKALAGVYQRIINEIPPHDVYIEPFLGDGGVLRRKRPALRTIGVEMDPQTLADKWRGDELPGLELYRGCGITWLRHAFGIGRYRAAESGGDTSRLRLPGEVGPRAFVYCDPPYPLDSRLSGPQYRCEMTDDQHDELLWVIRQLPCMVAISSYPNPMYERALEDWRQIRFLATTRSGKQATECVWFNYAAPEVLHDYRYLGREKRERERIRRKVRNWSAGLQRLPKLERDAILAELAGHMDESAAGS